METISKVDISLREEVLSIVDQLNDKMIFLNNEIKLKGNIALPIIDSINYAYLDANCGNHFPFENILIPYLKKMDENKRLKVIKSLLTVGYIDVGNNRVFMRVFPYLNKAKNEANYPYVTDIPVNV